LQSTRNVDSRLVVIWSVQWSFGVTVWELFTLAQQPYADVDPFEMAAYLEDGYRLAQPHNWPSDL